jgi:hypothetical protein
MLIRGSMYLIELFSAKEDQVRLVTFLLSAALAIVVLLVNQLFINKRSKRDFLLNKIEELTQLSIEYVSMCGSALDELKDMFEDKRCKHYDLSYESVRKMNAQLLKIEMICVLYFEKTGFQNEHYSLSNFKCMEYLHKYKELGLDDGDVYEIFNEDYSKLQNYEDRLASLCFDLAKQVRH